MPYGMNLALVLLLSIVIVSMFSVFVALRSFPKASAKLRGFFLPTKYSFDFNIYLTLERVKFALYSLWIQS